MPIQSKRGFSARKYLKLSQDHLVTAALSLLIEDKKEPSFENLVAEAFTSFPERFLLQGYPEWPNAHVVGKAWVRCRTDKKWITGSASQGFALTPLGEQIATRTLRQVTEKAEHALEGQPAKKGSRQTISSRVVLRIEGSPAYNKFISGEAERVTEYEFCELLYCTVDSLPETVAKNFTAVAQQVAAFDRQDLLRFLETLKNKFAWKFVGTRPRGGLMPRKKETSP